MGIVSDKSRQLGRDRAVRVVVVRRQATAKSKRQGQRKPRARVEAFEQLYDILIDKVSGRKNLFGGESRRSRTLA
jgi:hypothetical protein